MPFLSEDEIEEYALQRLDSLGSDNKIQTLTKTRDTLLPKLMSGKLRIKEENIIEEGK